MVRHGNQLRIVLVCLGLGLPTAVGRAADPDAAVSVWPGAADAPVAQNRARGQESQEADSPETAAPRSDDQTPPRPSRRTTPRPFVPRPDNDFYKSLPQFASPNRPHRDVRLAANVAVDADQPQSSTPTPPVPRPDRDYYNSLPQFASPYRPHHDVRLAAQMSVDADQPQPATPMATGPMTSGSMVAADGADPMQSCNSHGCYWAPDCDFPLLGRWYGGADYLLLRPHQSKDSAFETTPNGGAGPQIQNVNFDAKYNSGVHAFLGCDMDCDQSLRFSYTYVFNDTLQAANVPAGSVILTPLGANLSPGDSINATQHIRLNLWDVEDVRKLELPSCVCNGCCPGWDMTWSWGARIIDLEESINNEVSGPDAAVFTQKSTFVGAGPRIGFELRRHLGQSRMTGFLAADAALLLGGLDTIGTNTPSGLGTAQIVPNFDIQLGVCWQPRPEMSISAGWMFETFGDAVMLNQDSSAVATSQPQTGSLSYDGLFARGEFHF